MYRRRFYHLIEQISATTHKKRIATLIAAILSNVISALQISNLFQCPRKNTFFSLQSEDLLNFLAERFGYVKKMYYFCSDF